MKRIFCHQCQFWDPVHVGSRTKSKEGRCRRKAPTPHPHSRNDTGTHWPLTFDDDWCGEGALQKISEALRRASQ
jgi:hypothetical protein